ncbi:MAG: NUDIX hydrolase [Caldisericaceae bacterium]|nr:NUDIX hydrolase [Caldisericaceae bacterium]
MEIIKKERIFKGKLLSIYKRLVKHDDGTVWERETASYNGNAAAIVAVDGNEVVLIKQFRPSVEETLLEIPAGRIDDGETPEQAASRELEEETGLKPLNLRKLVEFYPTPGFVDEKIYLFYADKFEKGSVHLDEGEVLRIFRLPVNEVEEYLFSNKIKDGKTLIGLLLWKVRGL